jgi:hypothetical protein
VIYPNVNFCPALSSVRIGDVRIDADVKVIGKIMDVCPQTSCWMSIEIPGKRACICYDEGYGFFVPFETYWKNVAIDGQASVVTTSVEEI